MSVASDGRKMLRFLEVRNSQTPIERKPSWIKTTAKMGPSTASYQGARERAGSQYGPSSRPGAPTSTSAGRIARPRS